MSYPDYKARDKVQCIEQLDYVEKISLEFVDLITKKKLDYE